MYLVILIKKMDDDRFKYLDSNYLVNIGTVWGTEKRSRHLSGRYSASARGSFQPL